MQPPEGAAFEDKHNIHIVIHWVIFCEIYLPWLPKICRVADFCQLIQTTNQVKDSCKSNPALSLKFSYISGFPWSAIQQRNKQKEVTFEKKSITVNI